MERGPSCFKYIIPQFLQTIRPLRLNQVQLELALYSLAKCYLFKILCIVKSFIAAGSSK